MASNELPPVPTNADPGGFAWSDWYAKLRTMLNSSVRSFNSRTGAVVLTSGDVTTALTYVPYNSTNPAGYITAASAPVQSVFGRTGVIVMAGADVTTALGYTPYNATNPSGYISTIPWATPGTIGSTTPNTGAFTKLTFPTQTTPATPAAGNVNLYGLAAPSGVTRLVMQTSTGAELAFFRDSVLTVRNNSGATINKGQMVYVTGSTGVVPTIGLAKADAAATTRMVGMALANIANNAFGTIQTGGEIRGINTSAFVDGDIIWLSAATAGAITATEPTSPNLAMRVGTVVLSNASGIIQLFIQPAVINWGSPPAIGNGTPSTGSFSGLTDSGDLAFTGTGNRITGNFSNATIANRVMWQSSTVNGNTSIAALPNGTSQVAGWQAFNGTDPANASQFIFQASAAEMQINSNKQGTGTYLPVSFYVSGAIGVQIDTSGNLTVVPTGAGLRVKEGSNAKQGTAVLVGGTKTVSNTSVTANSRIFLTSNADGGTPGWLRVSARVAGTSFTITSSSGTDTSTVAYEIFEPT